MHTRGYLLTVFLSTPFIRPPFYPASCLGPISTGRPELLSRVPIIYSVRLVRALRFLGFDTSAPSRLIYAQYERLLGRNYSCCHEKS